MLLVSRVMLLVSVVALVAAVSALARQVGVLHERIAPVGALTLGRGPQTGEAAPQLTVHAVRRQSRRDRRTATGSAPAHGLLRRADLSDLQIADTDGQGIRA
jgi:hypothetical protein